MDTLLTWPTARLRTAFATGEVTPLQALEATLAHVRTVNPAINAVVALDETGAREAARAAGQRWASGAPLSPLDGVPVTVKDSIAATGMPWRHGTAPNDALPDSTVDAPPTARLREAGAVVFAKTAMPDFGMSASGVSSLYGTTRNPWDLRRSPGGSSSGAGAALAAGIGWGAVGSDIAGSVRLPAGHCGLVALKPTQGRIAHVPSSTVRSAGPMARSVAEVAELYDVIARPDHRDELSLPAEVPPVGPAGPAGPGLRVGVLLDLGHGPDLDPRIAAVVRRAADVLATGVDRTPAGVSQVTEIPAPFHDDPYPALDRVFQVRARTEWEAFDSAGRARVQPEIVRWSAAADRCSATDLERSVAAVARARNQLAEAVAHFDVVLAPVLPVLSFDAEAVGVDPDRPLAHCGYTCWFNQTGQPAAALCFGMVEGLPVGIQVVGPRFSDRQVLQVAALLEERRGFTPDWPFLPRPAAQPVAGPAAARL